MPGRVTGLHITSGAQVKSGDRLMVLEAMQVEHWITAPFDARVKAVEVMKGAQVSEGQLLAVLSPRKNTA